VDETRITPRGHAGHPDEELDAIYTGWEMFPGRTCLGGYHYVGRVVESKHDIDEEAVEYRRVPCRRCNAA